MRWLLLLAVVLLFACQCGQIPTPEPTATGTAVPTPLATLPPTATPTRQISPTATNTAVPTQTATPLPTATVTDVPATPTPLPTLAPSPVPTIAPAENYYVVQKDDWLIKIAIFLYGGRYGWEWECLWRMNRQTIGDNPHLIFRGQKLVGIRECGE